jgi:hypothetical protein
MHNWRGDWAGAQDCQVKSEHFSISGRREAASTRSGRQRTERLIRDCGISLFSSFLFFALSYATNIVFARILSPADYGDYAIGMTTLALGSLVALAGSGQAMTRFVPAYLAKGDMARASGFIRFFVPFASEQGFSSACSSG